MKNSCINCTESSDYQVFLPITESLRKEWEITKKSAALFNIREGYRCSSCGVNIRAQGLARAILNSKYGFGKKSLKAWAKEINKRKLKVCELNACHDLHSTLKTIRSLVYCEYGTPSEENIENLSFDDKTFDIVLHSEVLEHVDDPGKAMDECRRILKDDGIILFTTPVIWSRRTRQRSRVMGGEIEYILPKSYHGQRTEDYLVKYEFGRDIDKILGVSVVYDDWKVRNYVFMSTKTRHQINFAQKSKLVLQEMFSEIKGVA